MQGFSRFRASFLTLGVLTLASLVFVPRASAQGSPYYFFGFGDPLNSTQAHLRGLSGTGTALTDGMLINEFNPASFSYFSKTMLDLRLRYSYDQSTLGSEQGTRSMVKLGGFAVGTSLWHDGGMGASLGFTPVTDAEAQTQRVDSLGTTIYKREGGLSQFFLGLSARPIGALSIGGRFDIIFGNVRTQAQSNISGNDVESGVFQREYGESGVRATAGFILALDSIIPELRGLTIGAAYTSAASLTSTQRTIVTPISTTLDSTIEEVGYGAYPSSIRLGLAGRFGDRYRVEADIIGQDFSNSRVFSATSAITGDPNLGSSNRYAVSFERVALPALDARLAGFWEKIGLRFGATYAQLPFRPVPGVTVSELGGSFGVGLPFGGGSMLDVAAEIGIRTPSDATIAPKETYFKLNATMMLHENWFVPFRRTDDE